MTYKTSGHDVQSISQGGLKAPRHVIYHTETPAGEISGCDYVKKAFLL